MLYSTLRASFSSCFVSPPPSQAPCLRYLFTLRRHAHERVRGGRDRRQRRHVGVQRLRLNELKCRPRCFRQLCVSATNSADPVGAFGCVDGTPVLFPPSCHCQTPTVMASSSSASQSSFGKAFQRRLYSVLLDRSTVVAIIVLCGLVIISTLRDETF